MTQHIFLTAHHDGQNTVSEWIIDNRGTSIRFIIFVTSSEISSVKKFYFIVELWSVVENGPTGAFDEMAKNKACVAPRVFLAPILPLLLL